jgi:hypothetical protein
MPTNRKAEARAFAGLYTAAGVLFLALYNPCAFAAENVSVTPSSVHRYVKTYAATAYISLLSITIFSRNGVGFGTASAQEEVSSAERKISLQFLSGSYPARAHGLNRFGFIQENIRERNHKCAEADYFGLITASGEESLAQAKAALEAKGQEKTPFVAAQASIDSAGARYDVRHMMLPSSYRGSNAEQLLSEVRASFLRPEAGQMEKHEALHGERVGTFLYSLREAMLATGSSYQTRFLYNGKTFQLRADKRHDERVGRELQKAEVAADAANVTQLDGVITNVETKEVTTFRLWFDCASDDVLPLRFEFRPKSYLKLVFTASNR